jgi:hypothetical protein
MGTIRLLAAFLFFLTIISCDTNSFTENESMAQKPTDLKYMDIMGAREGKGITTTAPSVDTGRLIPVFEIVNITKTDGTVLDASYLKFVSIGQSKEIVRPIDPALIVNDANGNPITTVTSYDTSKNGIISIADGNNFTYGDYFFTIKVSTKSKDIEYSTVFDKAFKLNVGPLLPSILIYSPKNQNLVFGTAATKTNKPIVPNSNPEIKFELGSNTDKLVIDAATGVVSLAPTYVYVAQESISPTVNVVSKISGEVVRFTNMLTLIISNTPVAVPLESIYFFYPTLKTLGSYPTGGDGYQVQVDIPGNGEDIWGQIDNSAANALSLPPERPTKNAGQQTVIENQMFTGSTSTPTSSWMVTTTQDLTPFQFGYKLSFNYYYMPAYQTYMADGRTPADMEVFISTNYTGGDIQDATGKFINGTWTKVNSSVKCQRSENVDGTGKSFGAPYGTEFIGTPYPGDQRGADPDGRKKPGVTFYNRWVKCTYDIPVSQISKNYTVAFKATTYFEGSLLNNTTKPGRSGTFFVSDFNYKATE